MSETNFEAMKKTVAQLQKISSIVDDAKNILSLPIEDLNKAIVMTRFALKNHPCAGEDCFCHEVEAAVNALEKLIVNRIVTDVGVETQSKLREYVDNYKRNSARGKRKKRRK